MKRSFLMAVGVAAIDGLLCAFVAVLALAFLLQGEPERAQVDAEEGMVVVEVTWRASSAGDARNNLVLGLHAERSGCEKERFRPDNKGRLRTTTNMTTKECIIQARWMPCSTLRGQCTAWLFLHHVKPTSSYRATVYVAGTDQHDQPSADQIIIHARTYASPLARAKMLRERRLTTGDLKGATLVVNIGADGVVRSSWVSVPPAV